MQSMGRTNIVLDDGLVARVMRMYGFRTKRAAIHFALKAVAGERKRRDMLDLYGSGWEGDLDELRGARMPTE